MEILTKLNRFLKMSTKTSGTSNSLAFTLILGKCFAMFPVNGLGKRDIRVLRFKWFTLIMLYSVVYLIGIIISIIFFMFSKNFNFGDFVSIFFFSSALLATVLFIRLGRVWPKLMLHWTGIDKQLREFETENNLTVRVKIISMVVLIGALVEHLLSLCSAISSLESEGSEKFTTFLKTNYRYAFDHVSFAVWKALLFLILNFMCTFSWNYMDLFIMVISTAMTQKFKIINYQLKLGLVSKSKDFGFWNKLRENYLAVTNLCRALDDAVSDIVLLSFGNNLFFVLIQLFNSLKPRNFDVIGRIYFIYSFIFLICRTIAVLLYASSINETSRQAATMLMSTPTDVYNIAIERFLYKIQVDPPALTGKRFFNVTRPLILSIAGAIVTYELVLIQFHVVKY